MLFDCMVTGRILAMDPASAVRGPQIRHQKRKPPVLTPEEARPLLDSIDVAEPFRPARSRFARHDGLQLRARVGRGLE
jgi:hypothetical protein